MVLDIDVLYMEGGKILNFFFEKIFFNEELLLIYKKRLNVFFLCRFKFCGERIREKKVVFEL